MATKNSSTYEKVGWDPGNGTQKAAWINGKVTTLTLPNVAGIGGMEATGLNLAGLDSQRRQDVPHRVEFGGVSYLVGNNVASYARPIERMDTLRLVEGAELRAMLYAVLGLLGLNGCQVGLTIGLPVELVEDKAQAVALEKEMAAWVMGQHRFSLNGQESAVEVVRMRATIAQPLGTWLDWGFNQEGQWAKGAEGRKAPALVIDQGFHTLDLFGVEDGRPSPRFTAGERLGMARAAEMIGRSVAQRYGVELSLHEADGLLRQQLGGEKPTIYSRGELVEVGDLVSQALNSLAAEVLQFVERVLGRSAGKFRLILSGGGALALSSRLRRQYPEAEMAPTPEVANARGLGKLAASGYLDR